jgi:hypothetical protein
MKTICTIVVCVLALTTAQSQNNPLTDFLIFPRFDSAHWYDDLDRINSHYSASANPCQTCFTTTKDSVERKFCIQTSLGHARLDTLFNNVSPESLVGKWSVVKAGVFEVSDSTASTMDRFVRSIRIIEDQKTPLGSAVFTDKKVYLDITTSHGRQRDRGRYVIIDKQYLMAKRLIGGACGPTMIGITTNGLLIMDIHSYETNIRYNKYFVFRTKITRLILQRETQRTVSVPH